LQDDEEHRNVSLDLNIDLEEMLQNTFKMAEEASNLDVNNEESEDTMEVEEDVDRFDDLMNEARRPLYNGCSLSSLSSTLLLYNLKVVHGWSEASLNELLFLLKNKILPSNNYLPCSTYEAKKKIQEMGLQYDNIHACPNDCILYRGDNATLEKCPICKERRWKKENSKIPHKVVRHFPLLPRLLRQYRYEIFETKIKFSN
jgi:hypothetical protein